MVIVTTTSHLSGQLLQTNGFYTHADDITRHSKVRQLKMKEAYVVKVQNVLQQLLHHDTLLLKTAGVQFISPKSLMLEKKEYESVPTNHLKE